MPEFVLVWDDRMNDTYEGVPAAIYKDGRRVWFGSSCDEVQNILEAALGGEAFEVYRIDSPRPSWLWPDLLADVPGVR